MLPDFTFLYKEFEQPYYVFAAGLGVLVTLFFCYRMAEKRRLDEVRMLCGMLAAFVGVFVGGHALYAVVNIGKLGAVFAAADDGIAAVVSALAEVFGGSVFYGGLLGAAAALRLYLRRNPREILPSDRPACLAPTSSDDYIDIGALCIPLFHTFGRIGCLIGGCCYGIEAEWGVTYRYSMLSSLNGTTRVPVQFFESCFNLALFCVMCALYEKFVPSAKIGGVSDSDSPLRGQMLTVYMLTYPLWRFAIEFLRGDDIRGFVFGLSTSQIISIVLFCAGVCRTVYLLVNRNRRGDEKSA